MSSMTGDEWRNFDPEFWDTVKRDRGCCVYCGVDMLTDVRFLRTLHIDHLNPSLKWKDDWNNRAVSCSFCNGRKRGWNPVTEGESGHGLEPEEYRQELIKRSKNYIQSRLPGTGFPVIPADLFDALHAALKDDCRAVPCRICEAAIR